MTTSRRVDRPASRCLSASRAAARTWTLWLVILGVAGAVGCSGPPPPPPSPSVAEPPPPPPPEAETELRLELSGEESAALAEQAARDLEEAERRIGRLDRARLTAEELEKLRTVESLVTAAQAAADKGDVPGRANLARKARLLAEELVPD